MWVDRTAIIAQFKVQMGAGGIASGSHVADSCSAVHNRAAANSHAAVHQVAIERKVAIAMVDHDRVAVSAVRPAGVDHHAMIYRIKGIASLSIIVETVVHWRVVLITTDKPRVCGQLEDSTASYPGSCVAGISTQVGHIRVISTGRVRYDAHP